MFFAFSPLDCFKYAKKGSLRKAFRIDFHYIQSNRGCQKMKRLKRIIVFLLGITIAYCISLFLLILSSTHDTPTTPPETILVLGARVIGTTPQAARPSTVLKERLDAALPYIKRHKTIPVVVSGGQGSDEILSEAAVMKRYLLTHGVPEKQIIVEDRSTRTQENIRNAQRITPLKNVLIVTSDFHMYRAKLLAKRAGIPKISGLAAPSTAASKNKNFLREIIALGYGLLFDW